MSGNPPLSYAFVAPFGGVTPFNPGFILRSSDDAHIPCDLGNTDYQAFLAWIVAGNTAPEGWTGPTNPPAGSSP